MCMEISKEYVLYVYIIIVIYEYGVYFLYTHMNTAVYIYICIFLYIHSYNIYIVYLYTKNIYPIYLLCVHINIYIDIYSVYIPIQFLLYQSEPRS